MIETTKTGKGRSGRRYVRRSLQQPVRYEWCVQDADYPQFNQAVGFCDASDLPPEIVARCDAHTGAFYACEWPL